MAEAAPLRGRLRSGSLRSPALRRPRRGAGRSEEEQFTEPRLHQLKTISRQYQDSIKTVSRQYQDSIKTLTRQHHQPRTPAPRHQNACGRRPRRQGRGRKCSEPNAKAQRRSRTARSVWSAWSLLPLLNRSTPYNSASKLHALQTLRVAVHPQEPSPPASMLGYSSCKGVGRGIFPEESKRIGCGCVMGKTLWRDEANALLGGHPAPSVCAGCRCAGPGAVRGFGVPGTIKG